MKDNITKSKGPYYSTSRGEQKARKRNTQKARRQAGKKNLLRIALGLDKYPYKGTSWGEGLDKLS